MTSRRAFLAAAAAAAATLPALANPEPFFGPRQAGITTPQQRNLQFAVFDLATASRSDLVALMRAWTLAAARLTAGLPADHLGTTPSAPPGDSGEAIGLDPARLTLTLTFGFGPELFLLDGKDRFGLAAARPPALVDLPPFPGEQLEPGKTGGAIAVQACADDPQIAFHAVRQLARIGEPAIALKWTQRGFSTAPRIKGTARGTPRNLMGFKDGTMNPDPADPRAMAQFIWAGAEAPAWMQGGTYLVARRIRIALEHWDRMKLGFQEQVFGRRKYSGAPLGEAEEFAPLDLAATNPDGDPLIPATAHARLGAPALNGGAQILRRSYGYSDGADFVAERWPPWRQAIEYDAGLMFLAYQKDPRTGFIRTFETMSRLDALNQFTTHIGSGIFACPPGAETGSYLGQSLVEKG